MGRLSEVSIEGSTRKVGEIFRSGYGTRGTPEKKLGLVALGDHTEVIEASRGEIFWGFDLAEDGTDP